MADKKTFQEWTVQEPYLNLHCKLGEGPYYEEATNSVRFVDIINKRVHTVSLTQGPESVQTIQLDVPVAVTADVQGDDPQDTILLGVKYGIALLNRKTGSYEYLARFASVDGADGQDNDRLRSNDGAVDPHGRLWLGSMTDFGLGEIQAEGRLAVGFSPPPPPPPLFFSFLFFFLFLSPTAYCFCWNLEYILKLSFLSHPIQKEEEIYTLNS